MANDKDDDQKVRIRLCGNKPLVFDVEDVKRLRCEHRIVGSLMGSLPSFPQQNGYYGLPLLLSEEETTLILENEWGRIVSCNIGETPRNIEWNYPKDLQKYQIYCYLWHQGFFITSGEKFGGDYLAYPGDPMRYHSHYIIGVRDSSDTMSAMDLVTMGRLATNTKKTYVLATVDNDQDSNTEIGSVDCFSITWAGF